MNTVRISWYFYCCDSRIKTLGTVKTQDLSGSLRLNLRWMQQRKPTIVVIWNHQWEKNMYSFESLETFETMYVIIYFTLIINYSQHSYLIILTLFHQGANTYSIKWHKFSKHTSRIDKELDKRCGQKVVTSICSVANYLLIFVGYDYFRCCASSPIKMYILASILAALLIIAIVAGIIVGLVLGLENTTTATNTNGCSVKTGSISIFVISLMIPMSLNLNLFWKMFLQMLMLYRDIIV